MRHYDQNPRDYRDRPNRSEINWSSDRDRDQDRNRNNNARDDGDRGRDRGRGRLREDDQDYERTNLDYNSNIRRSDPIYYNQSQRDHGRGPSSSSTSASRISTGSVQIRSGVSSSWIDNINNQHDRKPLISSLSQPRKLDACEIKSAELISKIRKCLPYLEKRLKLIRARNLERSLADDVEDINYYIKLAKDVKYDSNSAECLEDAYAKIIEMSRNHPISVEDESPAGSGNDSDATDYEDTPVETESNVNRDLYANSNSNFSAGAPNENSFDEQDHENQYRHQQNQEKKPAATTLCSPPIPSDSENETEAEASTNLLRNPLHSKPSSTHTSHPKNLSADTSSTSRSTFPGVAFDSDCWASSPIKAGQGPGRGRGVGQADDPSPVRIKGEQNRRASGSEHTRNSKTAASNGFGLETGIGIGAVGRGRGRGRGVRAPVDDSPSPSGSNSNPIDNEVLDHWRYADVNNPNRIVAAQLWGEAEEEDERRKSLRNNEPQPGRQIQSRNRPSTDSDDDHSLQFSRSRTSTSTTSRPRPGTGSSYENSRGSFVDEGDSLDFTRPRSNSDGYHPGRYGESSSNTIDYLHGHGQRPIETNRSCSPVQDRPFGSSVDSSMGQSHSQSQMNAEGQGRKYDDSVRRVSYDYDHGQRTSTHPIQRFEPVIHEKYGFRNPFADVHRIPMESQSQSHLQSQPQPPPQHLPHRAMHLNTTQVQNQNQYHGFGTNSSNAVLAPNLQQPQPSNYVTQGMPMIPGPGRQMPMQQEIPLQPQQFDFNSLHAQINNQHFNSHQQNNQPQQQESYNLNCSPLNFQNFNGPMTNVAPVLPHVPTAAHPHPYLNSFPEQQPEPNIVLPDPNLIVHSDPRTVRAQPPQSQQQRPPVINNNSPPGTGPVYNNNVPISPQMIQERAKSFFSAGRPAYPHPRQGIPRHPRNPNNINIRPRPPYHPASSNSNNPNRFPLGVRPRGGGPGSKQGPQRFPMSNPNFINRISKSVNPGYNVGGVPVPPETDLNLQENHDHDDYGQDDVNLASVSTSTSAPDLTRNTLTDKNNTQKTNDKTNTQLTSKMAKKAQSKIQGAMSRRTSETAVVDKGPKPNQLRRNLSTTGFYTLGPGRKRNQKTFEEAPLPVPLAISRDKSVDNMELVDNDDSMDVPPMPLSPASSSKDKTKSKAKAGNHKKTSETVAASKTSKTPKKTLKVKLPSKRMAVTEPKNPISVRAANSSATTTPKKKKGVIYSDDEQEDRVDSSEDLNVDNTQVQANSQSQTDETKQHAIDILKKILIELEEPPDKIETILKDRKIVEEMLVRFFSEIKQKMKMSSNPPSTDNDSEASSIIDTGRRAISPNRVEQETDDVFPGRKLRGSAKKNKVDTAMNPTVVLRRIAEDLDACGTVNVDYSSSKKRKRTTTSPTTTSTSTGEKDAEKYSKRGKKSISVNAMISVASNSMEIDSDDGVNACGLPSSTSSSLAIESQGDILTSKSRTSGEDSSCFAQTFISLRASAEDEDEAAILVQPSIPINVGLQKVKIESDFLAPCSTTAVKMEPGDHHYVHQLDDDEEI